MALRVEVHNRPARVKKTLGDRTLVVWEDVGTVGIVSTDAVEAAPADDDGGEGQEGDR